MRALLSFLGYVLFAVAGVWGVYLTEVVFWSAAGWLGIILGNLLFPFAAFVAVFYDGLANENWTLAVVYVVGLFAFPLIHFGRARCATWARLRTVPTRFGAKLSAPARSGC